MSDIHELIMFKPVPGGYVYQVPNPWVFGPARYYLANEAQKAELVVLTTNRPLLRQVLVTAVLAGAVQLSLWVGAHLLLLVDFLHGHLSVGRLCVMFAIAAIPIFVGMSFFNWLELHRLRSILAGLVRTSRQSWLAAVERENFEAIEKVDDSIIMTLLQKNGDRSS